MKAKTHFEKSKGQKDVIIVDELPYQVNKSNLLIKVADLVRNKKLEGISDIRDESDKSGIRVVFELKKISKWSYLIHCFDQFFYRHSLPASKI